MQSKNLPHRNVKGTSYSIFQCASFGISAVKCGNNAEILGFAILAKYGLKIVVQFA